MKVKLEFIASMLVFGSIGIFVKNIDIPSAAIVQWRTIIGSIFLLVFFAIKREKIDFTTIKNNIIPLIISGIAVGSSWALLFEAYKYTSVGMATIVYYCAPIIVFIMAPIVFKEKITNRQIIGIICAVTGMLLANFVSIKAGDFSIAIVYALTSAVLYASIMITNKFIKNMDGVQSTFVQIFIAAIVMTIYCIVTTGNILHIPVGNDIIFILILGIIHTGIALSMYFTSMQSLSPQNISIFSYIDPASTLIFAFIFLQESLSWYQLLGAVLIFGGAIYAQKETSKSKVNKS